MEIESYELYHIGTKLNPNVNLDVLKNKMESALKEKEYEIVEKPKIELPIKIGLSIEVLGIKKDVKVELNFDAHALNVVGRKPDDVFEIFNEIIPSLSSLGYELEATVLFYEIVTNLIIKSERNPREILNKSSKVNLEPWREVGDINVIGMRVGTWISKEHELMSLIIEPSPVSPSNRFVLKLRFQSKEKEKIGSFHTKLNDRVMQVIQSLGGA